MQLKRGNEALKWGERSGRVGKLTLEHNLVPFPSGDVLGQDGVVDLEVGDGAAVAEGGDGVVTSQDGGGTDLVLVEEDRVAGVGPVGRLPDHLRVVAVEVNLVWNQLKHG